MSALRLLTIRGRKSATYAEPITKLEIEAENVEMTKKMLFGAVEQVCTRMLPSSMGHEKQQFQVNHTPPYIDTGCSLNQFSFTLQR